MRQGDVEGAVVESEQLTIAGGQVDDLYLPRVAVLARARDRGEEPRRRHAWRERPDIGGASERVEAGRGDDDDHRRDGQREGQAPHQLPVQRMR